MRWTGALLTLLVLACGSERDHIVDPISDDTPARAHVPGYYTLVVDQVLDLTPNFSSYSEAHDINNAGTVVGSAAYWAPGTYTRAVKFDPGAGWTYLGTLFGGTSEAWSINDNGVIVGYSTFEGESFQHPVQWDQTAPPHELPVVGVTIGSNVGPVVQASARSINNAGLITGTAWSQDALGSLVSAAYLLNTSGPPVLIPGDCTGPYFGGAGNAVNDVGQVAGNLLCPLLHVYNGAVRMMVSSTNVIGDFVDNSAHGEGFGINQAGRVVGSAEWWPAPGKPIQRHAFSWSGSGAPQDLHLTGDTQYSSDAYDVNSSNIVVGQKRKIGSIDSWAFVAGAGLPMTVLPPLAQRVGRGVRSIAYAVNDNNTAVGASSTDKGEMHATLWKFHIVFTAAP